MISILFIAFHPTVKSTKNASVNPKSPNGSIKSILSKNATKQLTPRKTNFKEKLQIFNGKEISSIFAHFKRILSIQTGNKAVNQPDLSINLEAITNIM
jgi:hypothetical protein